MPGRPANNTSNLKIGSDVELGFVHTQTQKQIRASNLYTADSVGWGLDGHPDIAEIRTRVAECGTPEVHCAALFKYLKNPPAEACHRDITVVAGSRCATDEIGGHIHFSANRLEDKWPKIKKALDLYAALPLTVFENVEDAIRRRNNYGRLGASRAWDEHHFEYRTLPSFLVTAGLTRTMFELAYIIAHEFYTKQKPLSVDRRWWVKKFYAANIPQIKKYLPLIYKDVKQMELYPKYKQDIDSFFGLARVVKPWKVNQPSFVTQFLHMKAVTKTCHWEGNLKDYKLKELTQACISLMPSPPLKIFLYGMKKGSEYPIKWVSLHSDTVMDSSDILIEFPKVDKMVKQSVRVRYGTQGEAYRNASDIHVCIGLHYDLRKTYTPKILATQIIEKLIPEIFTRVASYKFR